MILFSTSTLDASVHRHQGASIRNAHEVTSSCLESTRQLCTYGNHDRGLDMPSILCKSADGMALRASQCRSQAFCIVVQGKIRWLRISRVCQGNVRRWKAEIGEQWRLQREAVEKAAALALMEERRKQYQADAQQRLAWVEEGLKQRLIEDNSCPVCCANAGWQTSRL